MAIEAAGARLLLLRAKFFRLEEITETPTGFKSLAENIDTTTSTGRLIFHVFGSIAEFERERIVERTREGLAAARNVRK